MKLYAYCLSDEVAARTVESEIGLAGAKPRLIWCKEIAAVVSEFDDEKAAVTRENVLAHERIVRRVLVETTPLPFRFGTIVSEARLQSYLNSQHASLRAQLARVRGCVEMSVKVIWKPEAIRHEDENLDAQVEIVGEAGQTTRGSGTAFLAAKRREILGDETLKARAEELSAWLASCLGDAVRESVVSLQPSESLVLSAAHLVERARLDEYREALRQARRERSELHFLTSGAWPPYSFTSAGS
jgi:Gas vesicle synthesis protein GvpL/GvpF